MDLQKNLFRLVKNLFHKAKEERADIEKYLMIYRNTPLASTSKSPMQMLQQRSARSQLPMSNVARRRLGIVADQQPSKNQHLPLHNFHIGQDVMCQSPITKRWFPAKIKALCPEPRSYQIETPERDHVQKDTKPSKTISVVSKDSKQRNKHKEQCQKRTLSQSDFTKIPLHPKRQITVPIKLNL